jgi:hypothetical protein
MTMDDKEKKLPERKPTRLKKFDYNTTGAYFITICTDKRQQILSRIVGVDVQKILQQRIRREHMATRISRSRYQGKRRL